MCMFNHSLCWVESQPEPVRMKRQWQLVLQELAYHASAAAATTKTWNNHSDYWGVLTADLAAIQSYAVISSGNKHRILTCIICAASEI